MKTSFKKIAAFAVGTVITATAFAALAGCGGGKTETGKYTGTYTLLGGPAALANTQSIVEAAVSDTITVFDNGSFVYTTAYKRDKWVDLDEKYAKYDPVGKILELDTESYQTYYGKCTTEYDEEFDETVLTIDSVTRVVTANYDSNADSYANCPAADKTEHIVKANILKGQEYILAKDGSMEGKYLQDLYLSNDKTYSSADFDKYEEVTLKDANGTNDYVGTYVYLADTQESGESLTRWWCEAEGQTGTNYLYLMATSDCITLFSDGSYEWGNHWVWDYSSDNITWQPALAIGHTIYYGSANVSGKTATISDVTKIGASNATSGAWEVTDAPAEGNAYTKILVNAQMTLNADSTMSGKFNETSFLTNETLDYDGLSLFFTMFAKYYGTYPYEPAPVVDTTSLDFSFSYTKGDSDTTLGDNSWGTLVAGKGSDAKTYYIALTYNDTKNEFSGYAYPTKDSSDTSAAVEGIVVSVGLSTNTVTVMYPGLKEQYGFACTFLTTNTTADKVVTYTGTGELAKTDDKKDDEEPANVVEGAGTEVVWVGTAAAAEGSGNYTFTLTFQKTETAIANGGKATLVVNDGTNSTTYYVAIAFSDKYYGSVYTQSDYSGDALSATTNLVVIDAIGSAYATIMWPGITGDYGAIVFVTAAQS